MMSRITLSIFPEEREALQTIARQERRDPRQQAALLLREALERRGLLSTLNTDAQAREAQYDHANA